MNENIADIIEEAKIQAFFNRGRNVAQHLDKYHTLPPDSDRADEMMHEAVKLAITVCAQFVEDKFDFCGDEIVVKQKLLEHFGLDDEHE